MTVPLGEIFGFPASNQSQQAKRYRKNRLCPYNNRVANCTKDKANDPLGVCSVLDATGHLAITCPIRFREDWLVTDDAAGFFFGEDTAWTSLTEVRLNDANGVSAGNIDVVLVAYDAQGRILDFGALEVQAVYISGNVRRIFQQFMESPAAYAETDWSRRRPRPDYLSSSRKRLVPQLLYKGTILKSWGKKQAVALHSGFFETLPKLEQVPADAADMVWLVYDLVEDGDRYRLKLKRPVYTLFRPALDRIITPSAGNLDDFVDHLQERLDAKIDDEHNPPDAPTLDELI